MHSSRQDHVKEARRLGSRYWDVFLTVKDSACVGACRRNLHS